MCGINYGTRIEYRAKNGQIKTGIHKGYIKHTVRHKGPHLVAVLFDGNKSISKVECKRVSAAELPIGAAGPTWWPRGTTSPRPRSSRPGRSAARVVRISASTLRRRTRGGRTSSIRQPTRYGSWRTHSSGSRVASRRRRREAARRSKKRMPRKRPSSGASLRQRVHGSP